MPDETVTTGTSGVTTGTVTTIPTTTTPTDTQQDKSADKGQGTDETPIMNEAQLKDRLSQKERAILKELGIDDLKTAKQLLADAKKSADEKLSETERNTKALAAAEKKAADAEARIAELEHAAKVTTFKNAVLKAATDAKAKYPDDVITAAAGSADFSKWLEGDAPNDKAIKTWVEEYKANRPDYFIVGNGNGTPGSPSNRNAAGNPTTEQERQLKDKLTQQIRRSF